MTLGRLFHCDLPIGVAFLGNALLWKVSHYKRHDTLGRACLLTAASPTTGLAFVLRRSQAHFQVDGFPFESPLISKWDVLVARLKWWNRTERMLMLKIVQILHHFPSYNLQISVLFIYLFFWEGICHINGSRVTWERFPRASHSSAGHEQRKSVSSLGEFVFLTSSANWLPQENCHQDSSHRKQDSENKSA